MRSSLPWNAKSQESTAARFRRAQQGASFECAARPAPMGTLQTPGIGKGTRAEITDGSPASILKTAPSRLFPVGEAPPAAPSNTVVPGFSGKFRSSRAAAMITDNPQALSFLGPFRRFSAYRLIEKFFRAWLTAIAPDLARKAYDSQR